MEKKTITITGLDCPDCAASLQKRIASLPGVHRADINIMTSKLSLEHSASLETIVRAVEDAGYGVESAQPPAAKTVFRLTGLDCPDCASKLEAGLEAINGIEKASLNFVAARLTVVHRIPAESVRDLIGKAGYGAEAESAGKAVPYGDFRKTNPRLLTTVASGILLSCAWFLGSAVPEAVSIALFLSAALVGGVWTFRRGIASLTARVLDMNVMMTVAVTGAVLINQWSEAASVAFLYSLSNLLESYTFDKTRMSIRSLMDLTPKEATVRRGGREVRTGVDDVREGEIVIVKPGERVSLDGIVVKGRTCVDQSPITGESLPVDKSAGDEVFAGTINKQGAVEIEVTRAANDTTLSKIIHLVEEAQSQRAPSQAFVDRFAAYYTPAVLVTVACAAIFPPILFAQPWEPWIYRGLALIIVACPCALVISTPVAVISAIGNAARHGVLIKGGAYLEKAGGLKVIAFDKTGTLTRGRLEVTDVFPAPGVSEAELLDAAAIAEIRSEHPIAAAILHKAHEMELSVPVPDFFEALPGQGSRATIRGRNHYIGAPDLFQRMGLPSDGIIDTVEPLRKQGKTVMLVGTSDGILGAIAVADEIRPESRRSIRALHDAGIEKVVMLSGDNPDTASSIGSELGIEEVRAGLLPEDKVGEVKDLLLKHGSVAMVGDGINDAPALATASVGIAMGIAGTDTALETADIALMSDDLSKLPYTIALSRKALRIIKQNIAFSILVKAAAVSLIFPGLLTLLLAVLSDMGASILVTLNGMRLINGKPAPLVKGT